MLASETAESLLFYWPKRFGPCVNIFGSRLTCGASCSILNLRSQNNIFKFLVLIKMVQIPTGFSFDQSLQRYCVCAAQLQKQKDDTKEREYTVLHRFFELRNIDIKT